MGLRGLKLRGLIAVSDFWSETPTHIAATRTISKIRGKFQD